MKLDEIIKAAESCDLTCSQVGDILMDQPTTPQGKKVESHAHMHTKEGFQLKLSDFQGSEFSFSRKKRHWEQATHLYPVGDDYGRMLIDSGTDARAMQIYSDYYGGVFQDRGRLPPDRSYVDRTGLEDIPPVTETTYTVYIAKDKNAPEAREMDDISGITPDQIGWKTGQYLPVSKKKSDQLRYKEKTVVKIPGVSASPAHSMFPDSESLVMHLTAALLSSAGIQVLKKLKTNGPGSAKTVGIFSKSAVLAVADVDPGVPVTMINRTLEVDTSQPRDHTGRYPATGRIIERPHNVNHIVVVLGHRDSGELNVITCFPSAQTTQQSIGTITSDKQDIAELEFGIHTLVDIDKNIVLYW